jgi:hypothetical protein
MLAQLLIRSVIYLTIHEHMLHQKFDRELYDLLALLHKSITFVSTAIFKIYFFKKNDVAIKSVCMPLSDRAPRMNNQGQALNPNRITQTAVPDCIT